MSAEQRKHWESIYETRSPTGVSWYRSHLDVSLELLKHAGINEHSRIIDVGAGASTLADDLIGLGIRHITALDLAASSLEVSKRRLSTRADQVQWLVGDVTRFDFDPGSFDVWHDRAVLHFLTDPSDATRYVRNATRAIASSGYAVIGGFASDGPDKCSGLPVVRREPRDIAALFGSEFSLIQQRRETHRTPAGSSQSFAYALLQKQT